MAKVLESLPYLSDISSIYSGVTLGESSQETVFNHHLSFNLVKASKKYPSDRVGLPTRMRHALPLRDPPAASNIALSIELASSTINKILSL